MRFSILTIFFFGRSTYQVLVRADYVYEFILALKSKNLTINTFVVLFDMFSFR